MRKIDSLLSQYAESHQTKFNKAVHYFCVPAIFFSLIGLLSMIPTGAFLTNIVPSYLTPYLHFGTLFILLGSFYYLRLSLPLFFGMVIFSILVLIGIYLVQQNNLVPFWTIMAGLFIIAWIIQLIGHKHEGKKPSFIKDLQFLMVGPAWTISHIFDALNIKY